MNLIKSAFESEVAALEAMLESFSGARESAQEFRAAGASSGVFAVSCPNAMETLAHVGSGHISSADAGARLVAAIAGDAGHDVEFGLTNMSPDAPAVPRRSVTQKVVLGKRVTWDVVAGAIDLGTDYLRARIEALSSTQ